VLGHKFRTPTKEMRNRDSRLCDKTQKNRESGKKKDILQEYERKCDETGPSQGGENKLSEKRAPDRASFEKVIKTY